MHLLADISAHGLGHLAQTAPVLNSIHELAPALRITVRSALPAEWQFERDDVRSFDTGALHFSDLLASVDAVVTKPGYHHIRRQCPARTSKQLTSMAKRLECAPFPPPQDNCNAGYSPQGKRAV